MNKSYVWYEEEHIPNNASKRNKIEYTSACVVHNSPHSPEYVTMENPLA